MLLIVLVCNLNLCSSGCFVSFTTLQMRRRNKTEAFHLILMEKHTYDVKIKDIYLEDTMKTSGHQGSIPCDKFVYSSWRICQNVVGINTL